MNEIKYITKIIGIIRAEFQEYSPMYTLEIPQKYWKNINPQKMGVTHESEVEQFTSIASGFAWHLPASGQLKTLLDQIAAHKSLIVRAKPGAVASRLTDALQNKTVLEWVELAIYEISGLELSNPEIKEPPIVSWKSYVTDGRFIDRVRLNKCRVTSIIPLSLLSGGGFDLTFSAESALSRANFGSCPPWVCGSGG